MCLNFLWTEYYNLDELTGFQYYSCITEKLMFLCLQREESGASRGGKSEQLQVLAYSSVYHFLQRRQLKGKMKKETKHLTKVLLPQKENGRSFLNLKSEITRIASTSYSVVLRQSRSNIQRRGGINVNSFLQMAR